MPNVLARRSSTDKSLPVVSVVTGLPRPVWRGRVHVIAFFVSLPAIALLVFQSDTPSMVTASIIYGIGLLIMFGASASYHRLAISDEAQQKYRKLDHASIFVTIAGSYTPYCLVALENSVGVPLLIAVWSLALLGVFLKLVGSETVLKATNGLYLIMGWLCLFKISDISASLTTASLVLLILGGILYSFGAFMFALNKPIGIPDKFGFHEFWHVFTVLAATSQFLSIWILFQNSTNGLAS